MVPHQTFPPDFYSILGLGSSASSRAIRNAYRKLAMKWHPDKCSGADQEDAKLKFQKIQEAYTALSDERKKALYDNGLYDPDDDEEDVEGLTGFINEMSGLMAEVQESEKSGKGSSFEDLRHLFVNMFSADLDMAAFSESSSQSAAPMTVEKKRSWGSHELSSLCGDVGYSDTGSSSETHIFYRDSCEYGNVESSASKKKKSSVQDDSISELATQCDHSWHADTATQHEACGSRLGLGIHSC